MYVFPGKLFALPQEAFEIIRKTENGTKKKIENDKNIDRRRANAPETLLRFSEPSAGPVNHNIPWAFITFLPNTFRRLFVRSTLKPLPMSCRLLPPIYYAKPRDQNTKRGKIILLLLQYTKTKKCSFVPLIRLRSLPSFLRTFLNMESNKKQTISPEESVQSPTSLSPPYPTILCTPFFLSNSQVVHPS